MEKCLIILIILFGFLYTQRNIVEGAMFKDDLINTDSNNKNTNKNTNVNSNANSNNKITSYSDVSTSEYMLLSNMNNDNILPQPNFINSNSNSNSNTMMNSNMNKNKNKKTNKNSLDDIMNYKYSENNINKEGKCSKKIIDHLEDHKDKNRELSRNKEDLKNELENRTYTHKKQLMNYVKQIKFFSDISGTIYVFITIIAVISAYRYTTKTNTNKKLMHYLMALIFSPFYILFYIFN